MRAERTLLNPAQFDEVMRNIHVSPSIERRSRPGSVRLRRPPAGSIGREGDVEGTFGRWRPAGCAEHIYEGTQRDRHLPVPGIVEEEPLKGGRPAREPAAPSAGTGRRQ